MKKVLLPVLVICVTLSVVEVLFLNLCKAQANVYHPFPDSNAVWNIHYYLNCISTGSAEEYYSIKTDGDTLLQNQAFHKLFISYVESIISGQCSGAGISA